MSIRLRERSRVVGVFVVACAFALTWVSSAVAATDLAQRAGTAGCIEESGYIGKCADGRGLVGPASIALSPDGANAYVASETWSSLAVLARNPADGSLTSIQSSAGCFDTYNVSYTDCTLIDHLTGAYDVAVSPDGKNVYVAAPADSTIATFDRNTGTGLLTQAGCVNADGSGGCADGRALDGATSVTVSPDGKQVYVAAGEAPDSGIVVFDRNTTTGALTQKAAAAGCVNETGNETCTDNPASGMLDLRDVELSPDGKSAYAVSRSRDAITFYERNLSTGDLTPSGCISEAGTDGCQGGKALIRAESVTVSPDGSSVYVAGKRSDAIAIFDRNPGNGQLAQKPGTAGCVSNSGQSDPLQADTAGQCADGEAMDGISSIAVLPDGSALYATAAGSSGVDIYERAADGALLQRPEVEGCITETGRENPSLSWTAGYCADGTALREVNAVIASADGKYAYTAATAGGVGVFDVVAPPQPPQPPAGDQGPAASGGETPSVACTLARVNRRSIRAEIRTRQRKIAKLNTRARSEPLGAAELHTLKRNRHLVKTLGKRLERVESQIRKTCPKS